MARIGIRTGWILVVVAVLLLPAFAAAADKQDTPAKPDQQEKPKDPAMSSNYPLPEPGRSGNLTYRERQNLLARKPLRKTEPVAPNPDRQPGAPGGWRSPLARKIDWRPKPNKSHEERVDIVGRGPFIGPTDEKTEK